MSGGSSKVAVWSTRLEPATVSTGPTRPDDLRLGELIETWAGDPSSFRQGRAVLVGYPEEEGVRRNFGRTGARRAPAEIRRWLRRMAVWDAETGVDLTRNPPLDAGDIHTAGGLERSQQVLGEVVAGLLDLGCVPIVLGGGHETAFGHFLGYAAVRRNVAVINLDAHLDVRPVPPEGGHSGTPFRQMLEHADHPLPGPRYVCLGAEPHAASPRHVEDLRSCGGHIVWRHQMVPSPVDRLKSWCDRFAAKGCQVYVSLDADVVRAADVPGVSAPNPAGLAGADVLTCLRAAGRHPAVASVDLVEINPEFDLDGRSARWASLALWNFLVGLASRPTG